LSQIHGFSGLAAIEAIIQGERSPEKLLTLCLKSIKDKKADLVLKALEGHYTEAGVSALHQSHQVYMFYQGQIADCDKKIQQNMEKVNEYHGDGHIKEEIDSVKSRKPIRHNRPEVINLGGHLLKIFTGCDATVLPGITDYTWMQLNAETGRDLSKWASEKHFTS
jgi:hypothetical protein